MPRTDGLPKKFYADVEAVSSADGWCVYLDCKPIKTPAGSKFVLPNRSLAEAVAKEWAAQEAIIDIPNMHLTRLCHVALDRTPMTRLNIIEECVRYAGTDACCYRVGGKPALETRQAKIYDPLLEWASQAFGVSLKATHDILPIAQPAQSLAAAQAYVETLDDFALTGFVYGCGLLGSYVLTLALMHRKLSSQPAFDASQIETIWQFEHWGEDIEAKTTLDANLIEVRTLEVYFRAVYNEISAIYPLN